MRKSISNTAETLVAATKVKGAIVYDLAGAKIGNVDHVMIDAIRGCAVYAVMSFGASTRKGKKYHSVLSLPWANMKYDAQKGGYMVNLDKKVLEDAPGHGRNYDDKCTSDYGVSGLTATAKHQDTRIRLL